MRPLALKRRFAVVQLGMRRALGTRGTVGLGLVAIAAASSLLALRMHDEAEGLAGRAAELRSRRGAADAPAKAQDPAADPASFRDSLPPAAQSHEDLRTIFGIAARHRIALPRGEYAMSAQRDARITAYDVVLPVRTSYSAVRGLVAGVLNEVPHASLSELRLERGSSSADVVDARIRLTLHYRLER
jgi:hypothetical protein